MTLSCILTTRRLKRAVLPQDGKLYVSTSDNWAWRNGNGCRLQPTLRRMLAALAASGARPRTNSELFDDLYIDRKDGGPDAFYNVISVRIYLLRKSIAPLGLHVRMTGYGQGYVLEGAYQERQFLEAAE